jgi:two-component system CheB/CheR fusion protein
VSTAAVAPARRFRIAPVLTAIVLTVLLLLLFGRVADVLLLLFLAILISLGLGVAVLDSHQRVQVWNRRAEDLWGLRPDEAVDHHFLSLDIGLPAEQLAPALRSVLSGGSERETRALEAVNRRGRPILCTATVLPLVSPQAGDGRAIRGAIVLMEDRAVEPAVD